MKRIVIFCSVVCLLCIALRWNFATYCMQKPYTFIFNDVIAQDYCNEIRTEFFQCVKRGVIDKESIAHLKRTCPIIKYIFINYKPLGVIVKVIGYDPLCIVNQELVFADNNALLEKRFFSLQEMVNVPAIDVTAESMDNALRTLPQFLTHFSHDIQKNYAPYFVHNNEIIFTDKQHTNYSIICCADQFLSDELMHQCDAVKKIILNDGLYKKNVSWIVDTRFAHYIVAYKA